MKEGKYFSLSAARALPADRPALRRRTILAKDKKPMIALSRFTQLLALLVVMFLLSACGGGGGSSDQSTTFDIEGRVLNGPLDGSAVQVFGTNGGSALGTATTDGDGRYAAQVSRAGPYRLRASGGKLNGIDYTGVLEAACASGSNCFVTPYTTAILRLVGDHGFNTGDAASHLATSLEFDGDPFAGDVPAEAFDLDAARQAIAGGDGLAEWVASMVAWATSEDAEPPPGVGGSGSSGPPGAPGEPGEPDPVPPPAPDPDPEPVPDPDPDPVVPGTYNVSAIAGAGGSIIPASQTIEQGATATFEVMPEIGYSVDSVSGCSGSLDGNTYMTGVITGACAVEASFLLNAYTVSATAGAGGDISPTSQAVDHGSTATFTVTPETGYSIDSVGGCGATRGPYSEYDYVTSPVNAPCTITASFLPGYSFSEPTIFSANAPYYLEIFDLNDDGYREIINPTIVGTQWTGYSGVLELFRFGSADNPFANATSLDIGDYSSYVSAFDLVGSDDKGLFVSSRAGCSVDYYVINDSFDIAPISRFSTGSCGDRFVIGVDLNDDGLVDAISNSGSINVGLENGEFMQHHNLLGIWSGSGLAVADINSNGILDVVAYDGYETVAVFLGNGDATFQSGQPYSLQDEELQCSCSHCGIVMVGDINGNDVLDIVAVNNCMAYSLMGNGDGTFGEMRPALERARNISDVAAADLNGNGYLDLVVAEYNLPTAVRVYRGLGDGTFGLPFGVDVGLPEVLRVYVADVDGDGDLDLISAAGYNNSISVNFGE